MLLQDFLDKSACSTAWRELRSALLRDSERGDPGGGHLGVPVKHPGRRSSPRRCCAAGADEPAYTTTVSTQLLGNSARLDAFRTAAVGAFLAEAAEHAAGGRRSRRMFEQETSTQEVATEQLTSAAAFVADWVSLAPELLDTHVAPFFASGMPLPATTLRLAIWDARFGPLGCLEDKVRSVQSTAEGRAAADIGLLARRILDELLEGRAEDQRAQPALQCSVTESVVLVHLLPSSTGAEGRLTQAFLPESVAYAYLCKRAFPQLSNVAITSRVARLVYQQTGREPADSRKKSPFRLHTPSPDVTSPDSAVETAREVLRGLSPPLRNALVGDLSGWIPNAASSATAELHFLIRTFGLGAVIKMSQEVAAKAAVERNAVVWRFWTAEEMGKRYQGKHMEGTKHFYWPSADKA